MLYYFLKLPIRLTFMIFFRKVYITNRKNIPKGYSMILAVNHPTAFLDPIFPASFMPFTLEFLLRGDMFSSKLAFWALRQVKTIPIFRFRDGFDNLRRNQESFDHCYRLLREGKKHVLVLAEGEVLHAKRLKPIQKGVARMAFGAYEANGKQENIVILPTSVNYTDSATFRSDAAMLDFGKPIYLKDYLEMYQENDRKAIKKLTGEIQRRLRKQVIHVEDSELEPMVNRLLDINRNSKYTPIFPLLSADRGPLQREIKLADQVNNMDEEDLALLQENLKAYDSLLEEHGVTDLGVAQSKRFNLSNTLFLIFGSLFALVGYLLHQPLLWGSKRLADKLVKKVEFHSSIRFGILLAFYVIYWLLWLTVTLIIGDFWWILFALSQPILGYFSIIYRERASLWMQARKARQLDEEVFRKMEHRRGQLLTSVVPGYAF